jgi:DME family drug/metabolite transporter
MLVGSALVSGIAGGIDFNLAGILLALSAGVSYAAYTIFAKIAMDRKYRPLSTTYYSFVFMVAFALPFSKPWTIPAQVGSLPVWGMVMLFSMGLITAMFPYFLYSIAMKTLPAGTASALGIVEPMAGTIYGLLFFHEPMTWISGIGVILILGSVVALGLGSDSKKEKKET